MNTHHIPYQEPLPVGLTGGIGCGKTTVLQEFRKLGVPCFVADDVARHYYEEPDFVQQIQQRFGPEMLHPDGTVDKQALARHVFANKEQLQALNAMIHPRVMRDFQTWASQQQAPYVIIESAILYEYQLNTNLWRMVSVYVELQERLRRLAIRDHASQEQLLSRIHNQMDEERKMQLSHYVVLNYEGNPRARQVQYIHNCLLQEVREYIASKPQETNLL